MADEVILAPSKQYTSQSYGALTKVGGLATEEAALADEVDTTYLTTSFGTATGGTGNYVRRWTACRPHRLSGEERAPRRSPASRERSPRRWHRPWAR